jgi:Flp pilus assembly protein TadD
MTDQSNHNAAARALADGGRAWQAGRIEAAVAAFAIAARLAPTTAAAHGNLGVALRRLGRPHAAVASYRRALSLVPDDAATLSNLGNALREIGELPEAELALRRAVALDGGNRSFAFNLALLLRDRRQHLEALALMEALAVGWPENGELAWDLALTQLYLADFDSGWPGYEARFRLSRSPARPLPGPRWDGVADLAGKTLFLHSEQGFGDALQFVRFVPLAVARGARVVLECLPELRELFATVPGVAQLVDKGTPPPPYDLWAPMLSLPCLLGTGADVLPAAVPYLTPPARATGVRRPPGTALTLGLVWAGKTTPRDRSWPLEELLPLLSDPRIAVHALQVGPRGSDLDHLGVRHLVHDLGPELNSFADTAAAMAALDLVITVDTSVAHLAGALGRPCWVLLRYVSDWRWQDEPADSPWYPSMRLFRQADPQDFKGPVAELMAALTGVTAATPSVLT